MKALLILVLLLTCAASEPHKHVVGGKDGWTPGINFTSWAAGQHFFVRDFLAFYYKLGFDVMEVNLMDFQECSAEHPISNNSRQKSYFFRLNRTGPFYFICSRSRGRYCRDGMKLAVNVEPLPSSPEK